MTPVFLDANVFLRYILADGPPHLSMAARDIIGAVAEGSLQAWTTAVTVAEIVFVLSSPALYRTNRPAIRDSVLPIIRLPGLEIDDKTVIERALGDYASLNIDFIDAYHAALVLHRRQDRVVSFDHDFDRVPGMRRIETLAGLSSAQA